MDKLIKQELIKIVDNFKNKTIGIIGDVILDKYIFGKVRRISPEAPVPIVEINSEKISFGGSSNVASNISDLGGKAVILSVLGNDSAASEISSMMREKKGIDTSYIIFDESQKTIEKTRIIAEHQQVVRIDRETKFNYDNKIKQKMKDNIKNLIKKGIDALVLSDYGKGVLSREIIEYSIDSSLKAKIPIFVDPKIEHFMSYKKITSMTPNIMEAFSGMRRPEKREQFEIEKLGIEIVKKLKLKSLIITQSENGMTVFENLSSKIKTTHIPTKAKEVFDVTGAGDTVISVLSLGYAASKNILHSAMVANYAAGLVVAKIGTASATPQELKEVINE